MKLTTAQLDLMLTIPHAEVKVSDGSKMITALYHGEPILTGIQEGEDWLVTFLDHWTIPAFIPEEDRLQTIERLQSSWSAPRGA